MILNKPYTNKQYAELAIYANDNGLIIEDKGDYLETVEIVVNILETRANKRAEINRLATEKILAGFWYESTVDGITANRHYSYDIYDQQNFSDAFNMGGFLKSQGTQAMVGWNSYLDEAHTELEILMLTYEEFLDLYTQATYVHKQGIMNHAGLLKALVNNVLTKEAVENITWAD